MPHGRTTMRCCNSGCFALLFQELRRRSGTSLASLSLIGDLMRSVHPVVSKPSKSVRFIPPESNVSHNVEK